jgi:hypothetical protein
MVVLAQYTFSLECFGLGKKSKRRVGLGSGRSHGKCTSHIGGVPKRYIDRIDPVDDECNLSSNRPATNVLDASCLREMPSKFVWTSCRDGWILLGY